MRFSALLLAAFVAIGSQLPAIAQASTTASIVMMITSPPSTALSCPVAYPSGQTSFVEPVAAGTVVASCTVTPSTWSGTLALSGANASSFAISGLNVVVGSSPITAAGTYDVTVTATP